MAAAISLLLLMAGCAAAPAPVAAPGPIGEDAILRAAREVIAAAQYCALITIGANGHPQARVMDPAPPDARMVVTLMTNPASRKVEQIARDPRVTLFYFDEASPGYVTIIGRAERLEDPEEKRRRWLDRWTPHIPSSEEAVMYEVIPERIEVVSIAHGVTGSDATWRPPVIELSPAP